MRRIQRTVLVWRFENEAAPASSNFMPVGLPNGGKNILVSRVEASLFQDKAEMGVWLVARQDSFANSQVYRNWLARVFHALGITGLRLAEEKYIEDVIVEDLGDNSYPPILVNGNNARLSFAFDRVESEPFTVTAMRFFYQFVDALEVPESWHYYLPHPVVYQETMVRDPNVGWMPFGHDLADRHRFEMSRWEQRVLNREVERLGIRSGN